MAALAAAARASGTRAEVHVYPGGGHLFADADGPDYDPAAAELMFRRVQGLLAEI